MFNVKKKFFKRELKQTKAKIWGIEFSQFTTRAEREKLRKHYDKAQGALQAITERQKEKGLDKELRSKADKDKADTEKKVEELKKSLIEFDIMVDGAEPSEQYPQGIRGIGEQLEAHIQKLNHIKRFIKEHC